MKWILVTLFAVGFVALSWAQEKRESGPAIIDLSGFGQSPQQTVISQGKNGLAIVLLDGGKPFEKEFQGKAVKCWVFPLDADNNYHASFKIISVFRYPEGDDRRADKLISKIFPKVDLLENVRITSRYHKKYRLMEFKVVGGKYVSIQDWAMPELPILDPSN